MTDWLVFRLDLERELRLPVGPWYIDSFGAVWVHHTSRLLLGES